MQSAVDGMSQVLASVSFRQPQVPVIANTTAQLLTSAEELKAELLRQLCNGIQWQRSVEFMIDAGVTTFVEIGPGRVLTGLIKRISRDVDTMNIGDKETVRNLVNISA
jgi:[acyl-carrier-protein] S-malonyltransferase